METKLTCPIDVLGRVVIPHKLRAKLNWGEKDKLSFQIVEGNRLMLELAEDSPNSHQQQ